MKWGRWSTTAASNSSTPPDGWPEGQAPSTVNDCAREMMAQIRTAITDLQFVDLADSPTFVTATKFSVPGNLTATYQIGRRLKISDATTLYGTIVDASGSAASTTVSMMMDAGNMTASLSAISVAILSQQSPSLPDLAFKAKNVLVNGYLDIWNGGNSFSYTPSMATAYTVTADMWKYAHTVSSTVAVNLTRSERSANASNVPTLAQCGMFLNNSLCISVSAAMANVAATQFGLLDTRVEGFNFRQLAQKPMAFQFWVKSNRTGTYCMTMLNGANNVVCVNEYAISSTSWERKTFFVPPTPSSGTWDYSTGVGLAVRLVLACGSSFQGGAGNWTATAITGTSNQTNFYSSAGNTIRFAAFGLNEGTQCAPLEYKNILEEEMKCQRYRPYIGGGSNANNPFALGQVVNAGQALISVPYLAPTRIPPTGFSYNGNATSGFVVSNPVNALAQLSSIAVNMAGLTNAQLLVATVAAGGLGAAGDVTYLTNTVASASFVLTGAEL